jgi:hypothetical protein
MFYRAALKRVALFVVTALLLSFRTRRILAGEESASLPSPLFSYIVIPNPFAYFANGVSLPAYGGGSAFSLLLVVIPNPPHFGG